MMRGGGSGFGRDVLQLGVAFARRHGLAVEVGEEVSQGLVEEVGACEGVGGDVGEGAVGGRLQAGASVGGVEGGGVDGVGSYRAGSLVEGPRGEGGRYGVGDHVGVEGVDDGAVGGWSVAAPVVVRADGGTK